MFELIIIVNTKQEVELRDRKRLELEEVFVSFVEVTPNELVGLHSLLQLFKFALQLFLLILQG